MRWLLDETLTLIEKKPEIGTNYRIVRAFNGQELRARVDHQQNQASVLESLRQRAARHAGGRHANSTH